MQTANDNTLEAMHQAGSATNECNRK